MANVALYVSRIRTAVYGEEVRGSIADAITAMNADNENATNSAKAYAEETKKLRDDFATTSEDAKKEINTTVENAKSSINITAKNAKSDISTAAANAHNSINNLLVAANKTKEEIDQKAEEINTTVENTHNSINNLLMEANKTKEEIDQKAEEINETLDKLKEYIHIFPISYELEDSEGLVIRDSENGSIGGVINFLTL